MLYFSYIIFCVASCFLWILIHEFSHLIAGAIFRKIINWNIYPYPHVQNGQLFFARIEWTYNLPELNSKELFLMKLAPRFPNIISGIMFCLSFLFNGPLFVFWIIFFGFGLIDMVVGSIGYSPLSDLREAAKATGVNEWILRVLGFGYVIVCVILFLILTV